MTTQIPTRFDGRQWETLGERGALLVGEGWRYLARGGVRHMTSLNIFDSSRFSLCGLAVALPSHWRGTGTQDEYERLARLPKCLRCMKSGAR
jgi:hypothetical protein